MVNNLKYILLLIYFESTRHFINDRGENWKLWHFLRTWKTSVKTKNWNWIINLFHEKINLTPQDFLNFSVSEAQHWFSSYSLSFDEKQRRTIQTYDHLTLSYKMSAIIIDTSSFCSVNICLIHDKDFEIY